MAAARPPANLGARGRRLWRDLNADTTLAAADAVLAEEACRIADRLDRLDALLRGDEEAWAYVDYPDNGGPMRLVVNAALAEARQQAAVLKTICAELRQSTGKATAAGKPAPASQPKAPGSEVPGVSSLTARIAQRRAGGSPTAR